MMVSDPLVFLLRMGTVKTSKYRLVASGPIGDERWNFKRFGFDEA
jgi:hypothetical protein